MNARWLDALNRRRHSRPVWVASFLVMVGGTAWFVITPSTLSYWLGTALYIPFISLIGERATRKGFKSNDPFDTSDMGDGPWGGP